MDEDYAEVLKVPDVQLRCEELAMNLGMLVRRWEAEQGLKADAILLYRGEGGRAQVAVSTRVEGRSSR